MKSFSFLIIFVLFFNTSNSQSNWEWLAPNPPYLAVYSSVVVGNSAFFWCDQNSVIKLDIPTEKFEMLPTYTPIDNVGLGCCTSQGIAFADSVNGFITDMAHGEFKTTDGGMNWEKTANSGSNIGLILFATPQIGWKLGGGGFYKTSNAGASWVFKGGPFFSGGGEFSKMYALNQNQLWVLTSSYYNGSGAYIWYSSNGGSSWFSVNTGLVSDSLNQVSYYDINISSSGIGFVIGSIYHPDSQLFEGFILKTTDSGVTWIKTKFTDERYKNILYINDDDWIILGNLGYYDDSQVIQRKTTDMGNTWAFSYPLTGVFNFYNAIYTSIKNAVFIFATFGIYKSNDKGETYSKITSETDVLVSDCAFDSRPKNNDEQIALAWLQFNNKPFLISSDGGYTWHQKSLPSSVGSYIWLVGISEEVIYMIVDQTKLVKSTDFGETWIQLNPPVWNTGLQALNVYSKDILVLKAYKNLVSTTDGGSSWILAPTLDNLYLEGTDIVNPGTIVGVGDYSDSLGQQGAFFKSTDFGLSWHISDTDNEVHQISMLSDEIGYAISGNKFYKTANGGESWNIVLSEITFYDIFSSFAFLDSLNGILSAYSNFKGTTDGGNNWTDLNYRIPFGGAEQMQYNAQGDLFLISGAKMIMVPSIQNLSPKNNRSTNQPISDYHLSQSYPNPFNSTSLIKYSIPNSSQVTLKIFNALGEELETLVNEVKAAGIYEINWNAVNLPSGVYFYRLQAGSFVQTRKMILMK